MNLPIVTQVHLSRGDLLRAQLAERGRKKESEKEKKQKDSQEENCEQEEEGEEAGTTLTDTSHSC